MLLADVPRHRSWTVVHSTSTWSGARIVEQRLRSNDIANACVTGTKVTASVDSGGNASASTVVAETRAADTIVIDNIVNLREFVAGERLELR